MENLHGVGVLFFPTRTLIFPAITVFWCFGVFKEADTLEKIILFISILLLLLYNFWRKLRRLRGSTAQTTSIATSMKLTGYHKPPCLYKNYKHKSIHTNYLGAPKEYLLV